MLDLFPRFLHRSATPLTPLLFILRSGVQCGAEVEQPEKPSCVSDGSERPARVLSVTSEVRNSVR